MDQIPFQALIRSQLGLNIGLEMAAYLLRRARQNDRPGQEVAAIGTDARTGAPRRLPIPPELLQRIIQPGHVHSC